MNPNVFVEAAGHLFVNFRLWLLDIGIRADVNGYKIKPVDYQATWDLDTKSHYCHSIGVNHSLFDIQFMIDYRAFECDFGLLGLAIPNEDDYDCRWYRYFPQLPLWEISWMDQWDWGYDYYKWTCNYLRQNEDEDG